MSLAVFAMKLLKDALLLVWTATGRPEIFKPHGRRNQLCWNANLHDQESYYYHDINCCWAPGWLHRLHFFIIMPSTPRKNMLTTVLLGIHLQIKNSRCLRWCKAIVIGWSVADWRRGGMEAKEILNLFRTAGHSAQELSHNALKIWAGRKAILILYSTI